MENLNKTTADSSASITDAQRLCLSHILRNCEQAIDGLLTMVEDKYTDFSPHDVADNLQSACRQLDRVLDAAKRGSFCALSEIECKFVSYYVKCSGQPDKGSKRGSAVLNVVE